MGEKNHFNKRLHMGANLVSRRGNCFNHVTLSTGKSEATFEACACVC